MSEEDKNGYVLQYPFGRTAGEQRLKPFTADDLQFQNPEFARLSGVSKIVVGRSTAKRKHILQSQR